MSTDNNDNDDDTTTVTTNDDDSANKSPPINTTPVLATAADADNARTGPATNNHTRKTSSDSSTSSSDDDTAKNTDTGNDTNGTGTDTNNDNAHEQKAPSTHEAPHSPDMKSQMYVTPTPHCAADTGTHIPESEFVDSANIPDTPANAGTHMGSKENVVTPSSTSDSIPSDTGVLSSEASMSINFQSQLTAGDEVATIANSISGRWEEVLRLNEKELSEVGGPFAWGGGEPNADDTPRGPLDNACPANPDEAVVLFVTGAVDGRRRSDEALLTGGESMYFYDGQSQEALPLLVGRKKRRKQGWRAIWPMSYFVSSQYEEDVDVPETVIGGGHRAAPPDNRHNYMNGTLSKFALFVIAVYLISQVLAFAWFVHLRSRKSLYDAMKFVAKWSANTLDVQTGSFWKIFTSFFVHTDALIFFMNFISAAQSSLFMTSTAYDAVTMICAYVSCGVAATFTNVWTGCSYTYGAGAATIGLATFLFVQLDRRRRQGLPVWYMWTVALLSMVQFVVQIHDAAEMLVAIFTGLLFGLIMKSLRRKSSRKRRSAVTLFIGYCFSLTGFFIFQYLLLALQHRTCIPRLPSVAQ